MLILLLERRKHFHPVCFTGVSKTRGWGLNRDRRLSFFFKECYFRVRFRARLGLASTLTLPRSRPRPRPDPVFYSIAGHGSRQDVFRAWLVVLVILVLVLSESIMLKWSNHCGVLYFESELNPHETPPVIEWHLISCPFDELVSKFKGYVFGYK